MATYIQANIGRNIDNAPISDSEWLAFSEEVELAIVQCQRNPVTGAMAEWHTGTGLWLDENSGPIVEESRHVSLMAGDPDLFALRVKLGELKRRYGQDYIALIVGSDLI